VLFFSFILQFQTPFRYTHLTDSLLNTELSSESAVRFVIGLMVTEVNNHVSFGEI